MPFFVDKRIFSRNLLGFEKVLANAFDQYDVETSAYSGIFDGEYSARVSVGGDDDRCRAWYLGYGVAYVYLRVVQTVDEC